MATDSQYILERIRQGCVVLADDEFVIDRLVKYFGNGRIRWHVEFREHRVEFTTGQLKKQPTFRRNILEQADVLPPQRTGADYRRWALDLRKNAIELPWRDRPVDSGFAIDRLVSLGDDRWMVDCQGKVIKFTTTKLRRQTSFRKRMLLKAKVLPPQLNAAAYRSCRSWRAGRTARPVRGGFGRKERDGGGAAHGVCHAWRFRHTLMRKNLAMAWLAAGKT